MANLRARLEELYGAAGRLELRHRRPRGTTVEVELPLRYRATEAKA